MIVGRRRYWKVLSTPSRLVSTKEKERRREKGKMQKRPHLPPSFIWREEENEM